MSTQARTKAFWKNDAFWFVALPTSLVAALFLLAMLAWELCQ